MKKWTFLAISVWLLFSAPVSADDLLYASDGKQLFTVDLQTGAMTFQSDGPLQWIASPAFDEQHHTRLWVSGNQPGGYGWLAEGGASYTWGNPITGETGGPLPAAMTYASAAQIAAGTSVSYFNEPVVYAPTTQRLYAIGEIGIFRAGEMLPIESAGEPVTLGLVDQYNGPYPFATEWQAADLESPAGRGSSLNSITGTFDPIPGAILVVMTGMVCLTSECTSASLTPYLGLVWADPATGLPAFADSGTAWYLDKQFRECWFGLPCGSPVTIQAAAVDPQSGSIYLLADGGLLKLTREPGEIIPSGGSPIGTFPFGSPIGNWSLRFADARYVQP
jgi:hypothetical protein